METHDKPLLTYLDSERGRRYKLAKSLSVSPSAISMWKGTVPLERLGDVSKLTGIPMTELRPDLFARAAS